MASSEVHWLVVFIPKLKPDGLERDASAWGVIKQMAAMLLVQDAAVSTSYVDARQDAAATRRA